MKKLLLFTATFLSMQTLAQKAPDVNMNPIATDRPDQTETPLLVPKGWVQVEAGTWGEPLPINGGEALSFTTPTILTKYGVNKNFELRLITEYSMLRLNNTMLASGLTPITVGFKAKLLEEKGLQPQTSIICHLGIGETGSKDYQTPYTAPAFRFLMSHTLTDKLNLSYNLGAEWDGATAGSAFIYTLSFAYGFSKRIGGFIESYGFIAKNGSPDHRADAGITYLVNNHQQIDISGGLGLSEASPKMFLSCGYSFRF